MAERGLAGALAPMGNEVREFRAPPRRAFRTKLSRRSLGAHVAPKVEHRAIALTDGRFKLITTTTTIHVVERVVDAEFLRRLGIAVPAPDVPWVESAPAQIPTRRAEAPEPEPATPYNAAISYWRERGFRMDHRLANHLGQWLDSFGLEGVLQAMHQAATIPGHGPPYMRLVREIRRLREESSR